MDIASLPAVPGARKRRKRLGRGIGSGHGKTSTRGQLGQGSRTGSRKRPGFEGGRTPLIRSIPKRGFKRKAPDRRPATQIVNVSSLERCRDGERVDAARLKALGLIRDAQHPVKLLGDGTLSRKLTVIVQAASASAREKIAKAGGALELSASRSPARG
ncbi:MAG TPA: 50S ribosomal protein L15 [bacterium]